MLPQAMLLLWLTIALSSCGSSESAEEKAQRPKKIAGHWVLDTNAFRKELVGYTEANWKGFEAVVQNKDQIAQADLDSMKRFMIKNKIEVIYRKYSTLNMIFRADSTFENHYPGGIDAGTYRFSSALDTIHTKTKGRKSEFHVPLLALSDTRMQLKGEIPMIRWADKDEKYPIVLSFVPKPKS